MGETVRFRCSSCGYETTRDIGGTMAMPASQETDLSVDKPNTCPQCAQPTLVTAGVELYWD